MKNIRSFTIVELVLVMGILGIIAAVVVVVINPVELLKQSRDSTRLGNIENLHMLVSARKYSGIRSSLISLGSAQTVYISLADSTSTCTSFSLPTLPSGWQYHCATQANFQNIDGTGWLPVDVSGSKSLTSLPIDPQNDADYYYAYVVDADGDYALTSLFESKKMLRDVAATDNGNDDARYEMGTNMALWNQASGLVGYWPFDEGSGTQTNDLSGNSNSMTLVSAYQWATSSCKLANCIEFESLGNATVVENGSLDTQSALTISSWFYPIQGTPGNGAIVLLSKWTGIDDANYTWYWYGPESFSPNGNGLVANMGGTWDAMTNYEEISPYNKWYFMTFTYESGGYGKLYVDGELRREKAASGALATNNAQVTVGSTGNGNLYRFDDLRIYNRALSATEIESLYKSAQ